MKPKSSGQKFLSSNGNRLRGRRENLKLPASDGSLSSSPGRLRVSGAARSLVRLRYGVLPTLRFPGVAVT
jgi:hypothetical protein